jgi:hypothetical protein
MLREKRCHVLKTDKSNSVVILDKADSFASDDSGNQCVPEKVGLRSDTKRWEHEASGGLVLEKHEKTFPMMKYLNIMI